MDFYVWASDEGSPSKETLAPALVSIRVIKVNRLAPQFSQIHYHTTLVLPTIAGVKLTCVTASDPDDSRPKARQRQIKSFRRKILPRDVRHVFLTNVTTINFSFSRESLWQHQFRLDKVTGCLSVRDARGLRGNKNVTVMATDGSYSATALVTISVQEQNSQSLVFSENRYTASILENSTKQMNVLVVRVTNTPMSHHLSYSILNPNKFVKVHPTSGVVQTTGEPFDREYQDTFTFIVKVIIQ